MFEFLYVFWLRKGPSIKYVPNCTYKLSRQGDFSVQNFGLFFQYILTLFPAEAVAMK